MFPIGGRASASDAGSRRQAQSPPYRRINPHQFDRRGVPVRSGVIGILGEALQFADAGRGCVRVSARDHEPGPLRSHAGASLCCSLCSSVSHLPAGRSTRAPGHLSRRRQQGRKCGSNACAALTQQSGGRFPLGAGVIDDDRAKVESAGCAHEPLAGGESRLHGAAENRGERGQRRHRRLAAPGASRGIPPLGPRLRVHQAAGCPRQPTDAEGRGRLGLPGTRGVGPPCGQP